ncbi:MAG: ABC transporter substrate-binding protein [Deltaproteobacteria bacterium]|nr:ABC transporter substrate-binding protein [Deltaproteobacteria bacterium]
MVMKIETRSTMKNIFLTRIILLTILVLINSQALAQTEKVPRGGTLKIVHAEPPHLNPVLVGGPAVVIPACQIFASLLQFDENFRPRPYLAKKWEISPDGRTYTFHLEKGATFHDGKAITSADVAFSLELVKKNHPMGELIFGAIEKVETPDAYTAIFKLPHPFPAYLAANHPYFFPILPKDIYSEGEIRRHPANVKPIGSGPFKFVEWKKGQYLILDRYQDFFRKGRPYLDRIIMEFIADAASRTIALETGAVHLTWGGRIPLSDIPRLEKMPHLVITTKGNEAIGTRGILQINHRKPPLDNLKVRKAIAHSIDKNFFIDFLSGYARPAAGPLRYTNPFHNPNLPQYEYDPAKANQMLDEAGFKKGTDGNRFTLSLSFYPGGKPGGEFLRTQLRKVGIQATLRPPPDYATWVGRISNWEYELDWAPVGDFAEPVIAIDSVFTSKNIKKIPWTNTMGYSNPEVDRLCSEARVELNLEKRKKLYNRVQEILMDELPVIWVIDFEMPTLYNKDFDGIPMDVWGMLNPLDTVFWRKGKVGP